MNRMHMSAKATLIPEDAEKEEYTIQTNQLQDMEEIAIEQEDTLTHNKRQSNNDSKHCSCKICMHKQF